MAGSGQWLRAETGQKHWWLSQLESSVGLEVVNGLIGAITAGGTDTNKKKKDCSKQRARQQTPRVTLVLQNTYSQKEWCSVWTFLLRSGAFRNALPTSGGHRGSLEYEGFGAITTQRWARCFQFFLWICATDRGKRLLKITSIRGFNWKISCRFYSAFHFKFKSRGSGIQMENWGRSKHVKLPKKVFCCKREKNCY